MFIFVNARGQLQMDNHLLTGNVCMENTNAKLFLLDKFQTCATDSLINFVGKKKESKN